MRTAPDPLPKGYSSQTCRCSRPHSPSWPIRPDPTLLPRPKSPEGPDPPEPPTLGYHLPPGLSGVLTRFSPSPHSLRHVHSRNGEQAVEGGRSAPFPPQQHQPAPDCSPLIRLTPETSHLVFVTTTSEPEGRTVRQVRCVEGGVLSWWTGNFLSSGSRSLGETEEALAHQISAA